MSDKEQQPPLSFVLLKLSPRPTRTSALLGIQATRLDDRLCGQQTSTAEGWYNYGDNAYARGRQRVWLDVG